jgi:hypothetical protein
MLQSSIGRATTRYHRLNSRCRSRTIDGMSDLPTSGPSDRSELATGIRRRWWTGSDNGDQVLGWEPDVGGDWRDQWPPCPDGKPLRLRHPLGFRERNVRELELRVLLGGDDGGVCQVIVDEHEHEVHVRVLVHRHDEHEESPSVWHDYCDWPVRVWLERPLGERAVIDADMDEELLLYTPLYLDNVVQPDHGYRPVHCRRSHSRRGTRRGSEISGLLGGDA